MRKLSLLLVLSLLFGLAFASSAEANTDQPQTVVVHELYRDKWMSCFHGLAVEELLVRSIWGMRIQIPPEWIRKHGFTTLTRGGAVRRTTFPAVARDSSGKIGWAWIVLDPNSSLTGTVLVRSIPPDRLHATSVTILSETESLTLGMSGEPINFSSTDPVGAWNRRTFIHSRFLLSDDSNGLVMACSLSLDEWNDVMAQTTAFRRFMTAMPSLGAEDFLTHGASLGVKAVFTLPSGIARAAQEMRPVSPQEILAALRRDRVSESEVAQIYYAAPSASFRSDGGYR